MKTDTKSFPTKAEARRAWNLTWAKDRCVERHHEVDANDEETAFVVTKRLTTVRFTWDRA